MRFQRQSFLILFLISILTACTWSAHVNHVLKHQYSYHPDAKSLTCIKKDTTLSEIVDSILILDGDTLPKINRRPTNYYTLSWFDSKERLYRRGLFYKDFMSLVDTTFHKNGNIRSRQISGPCYLCKNYLYHYQTTINYDKKGKPMTLTYQNNDSGVSYKQYYDKNGVLLEEKHRWPIYVAL